MALTFGDFKAPALSLDDFKGQAPLAYTPNEKSAAMLAGSQMAVKGGSKETYDETKARLLDPKYQENFIIEQQQIRDQVWKDFLTPGVPEMIGNPNISDQTKDVAFQGAYGGGFTMPLSSMSALAFSAASADSEPDASDNDERVRFDYIGAMNGVMDARRKRQSAINSLKLGQDQGTLGNLVDIGEYMVPFAEWIQVDQLLREATGQGMERSNLLGEQKRKLFKQIEGMSMDERAEFTDRVLEVIQSNPDVVLPDGNDLMAMDILNKMLIDNDYSNFERWFDNITSVLDVVGVGATVRSIGKAGDAFSAARGINKIVDSTELPPHMPTIPTAEAKLSEEAQAFAGRASDAPSKLAAEAQAFKGANEDLGAMGAEAQAFQAPKEDLGSIGAEAAAFKTADDPTAESIFGAMAETTRTDVSPTSPSQIIKDANPKLARDISKAAIEDETGEVAKAAYGTNRIEAAAKDYLPEPDIRAGRMENKVEMAPREAESENLRTARRTTGNLSITDAELGRVKQKLTAGFNDVEGMALHPSSLLVRTNLDGTIGITGRYSAVDSGHKSWADAVESAKFAFRKYGLDERNFIPLVRQGDEWVEMSAKDIASREALKEGGAKFEDIDYAVGLKYDYNFRPEDLEVDEILTSRGGILGSLAQFGDRIMGDKLAISGQGSLVQNLIDPSSIIHPQIMDAAYLAVDKSHKFKKMYVDLFSDFAKSYKKLDTKRRTMMADYIHEANRDGLPLSVTDLYSRGFNKKEIEMLKQWRRANDAMWYAANEDMVKTLRAKGNVVYRDADRDAKMIGVPVKRGAIGENTKMFDSVGDTITSLDGKTLDDLYDNGGEVIRLQEPVEVDGEWVEYILSRNTPQGGYTRALKDDEIVLAYRDGYYPVQYEANYFIEKHITLSDGTTVTKVVASAKDSGEVKGALAQLRKAEPDAVFSSRKDRRMEGNTLFDEGSWSSATNNGLSSQRMRGKRLGDAGNNMQNLGNAHLKDPLEAMANQIHQLSRRVSMRTFLETTKNRWMQSYGKYLDLPTNKFGQVEYPRSVADIKAKEGTPSRVLNDAKTNFNYVYSLENGYINKIDEYYRAGMQSLASMMGEIGWTKLEKGLFSASKAPPNQLAKTAAFKMFISLNPLRQGIIQRGQLLQLGAVNPTYAATGMVWDMSNIRLVRSGLSKNPKYVALAKEIEDAGILQAIDAHTFIREDMLRLADVSASQRLGGALNKPVEYFQRIGFDAAEEDVLVSAWLTFRDLAKKAGKNLNDQRVKDQILAQTRSYTGGMNRAGDMAYSQNTAGLMFQFFSFRHKMLLQPITNRHLSPIQRAELMAYNAALFGIDATVVTALVDKIMGNDETAPSELKDTLKEGLLDVTLNAVLSAVSGEKQAIDWGDFAPTEVYGFGNTFMGFLNSDIGEIIANSPAGSMFFGNNPRMTDAFKTALRYFHVADDYDDPNLDTKLSDVIVAFASLSSGYSNTFKARYAFHTGRKMSSTGTVSDEDVTKVESVSTIFGLRTHDEVGRTKAYEAMYGSDYASGGTMEDDMKQWYGELKRQMARRGQSARENELAGRIMSEGWRVFGEERDKAATIFLKFVNKDAANKDYTFINGIIKMLGVAKDEDVWKVINQLPDGTIRDNLTAIMNSRKGITSGD